MFENQLRKAAGMDKESKRRKNIFPESFPDYSRSLVTQGKGNPTVAGLLRGLGYGSVGALSGVAAGKMLDQEDYVTAILGILGGLAGAGAGYYSGSKERESENSRLLFLRRMGLDTPGEYEAVKAYPELARRLTREGVRI